MMPPFLFTKLLKEPSQSAFCLRKISASVGDVPCGDCPAKKRKMKRRAAKKIRSLVFMFSFLLDLHVTEVVDKRYGDLQLNLFSFSKDRDVAGFTFLNTIPPFYLRLVE